MCACVTSAKGILWRLGNPQYCGTHEGGTRHWMVVNIYNYVKEYVNEYTYSKVGGATSLSKP